MGIKRIIKDVSELVAIGVVWYGLFYKAPIYLRDCLVKADILPQSREGVLIDNEFYIRKNFQNRAVYTKNMCRGFCTISLIDNGKEGILDYKITQGIAHAGIEALCVMRVCKGYGRNVEKLVDENDRVRNIETPKWTSFSD